VTGLPAGASASFNPNSATTSSALTISVPANVPKGNYPLTITGTGGSPTITRTVNATLVKNKSH
jgi:uncharacterized membrane protein